MRFGPLELFIILMIVVMLFGRGRLTQIGSELGKTVNNFRKEVKSPDADDSKPDDPTTTDPAEHSQNGHKPV